MQGLVFLGENLNEFIYAVEEGDSLSSIANAFNTTENLIVFNNNLSSQIEVGQRLYIKRCSIIYTVLPSDDLQKIADKFNKSKEEILRENKCNFIYPTQRIKIE